MGVRRQPDGMSEANLQSPHSRRAHQRTKKNLLSHKYIQKTETISDLRFSAPLGARTLDPNIKSVVLYQLS